MALNPAILRALVFAAFSVVCIGSSKAQWKISVSEIGVTATSQVRGKFKICINDAGECQTRTPIPGLWKYIGTIKNGDMVMVVAEEPSTNAGVVHSELVKVEKYDWEKIFMLVLGAIISFVATISGQFVNARSTAKKLDRDIIMDWTAKMLQELESLRSTSEKKRITYPEVKPCSNEVMQQLLEKSRQVREIEAEILLGSIDRTDALNKMRSIILG